jgi:cardiolipin synthase
LARERVWLTDAYYAGTTGYVQTLRAAALQGVDVRLLLPGATDVPLLRALSRVGYRLLLEAGIRVFEWQGAMLHAKTAVVDGRWARVGSTNLNIASWFGNRELDAVVEEQPLVGRAQALPPPVQRHQPDERGAAVQQRHRDAGDRDATGRHDLHRARFGDVRS